MRPNISPRGASFSTARSFPMAFKPGWTRLPPAATAPVIADGTRCSAKANFVLLLSEGEFKRDGSRTPIGLYDLYRLEDGLIAEHWDVVDPSFPAPIYATLIEVEGQEGLHLIWSRPTRD